MKAKTSYRIASLITLIAFINLTISCSYYKINRSADVQLDLAKTENSDRYMIVHYNGQIFCLNDWTINEPKTEISGKLIEVSEQHKPTKKKLKPIGNRYHKKRDNPTNEMHIYLKDNSVFAMDHFSIEISNIEKVEIYEEDKDTKINMIYLTNVALLPVYLAMIVGLEFATHSVSYY